MGQRYTKAAYVMHAPRDVTKALYNLRAAFYEETCGFAGFVYKLWATIEDLSQGLQPLHLRPGDQNLPGFAWITADSMRTLKLTYLGMHGLSVARRRLQLAFLLALRLRAALNIVPPAKFRAAKDPGTGALVVG